jgi:Uma2 family endonuclease
MGGMGKTSLSREAAFWWTKPTGFFPEGACFVSFEQGGGAHRLVPFSHLRARMPLMRAAVAPLPCAPSDDRDQRVFLHGVSWARFLDVVGARGESSAVRVTYLAGELELMSPSFSHESIKKTIARLVEAYADELGLDLYGAGSWTLKSKLKKLGIEPDECYSIGKPSRVPELAIEVFWTSGGLDKLEVYRGLGVREVWVWKKEKISAYLLRGDRYVRAARSRLLPGLDLALVARLAVRPDQPVAVRELRAELRKGR